MLRLLSTFFYHKEVRIHRCKLLHNMDRLLFISLELVSLVIGSLRTLDFRLEPKSGSKL